MKLDDLISVIAFKSVLIRRLNHWSADAQTDSVLLSV